jgi:DNA modification methylase
MTIRILIGDVRDRLKALPSDSIHCCVTSPPYWGLRDYGVDGQIGLEDSPAEFVATMVDVFEEVRRVLRPDGTCWINMGDSYAGSWGAQGRPNGDGEMAGRSVTSARQIGASPRFGSGTGTRGKEFGLKPKDLVMMPHRLAIALQDAGWWVRQDIVWHKPNPMPESIKDRCTKSHEYIFLLTKAERYYFDQDAISEPVSGGAHGGGKPENRKHNESTKGSPHKGIVDFNNREPKDFRNKRSVWTMTTHSFKEAHFATFPPELPETCIKAGCPIGGMVLDPFFGAGTTGLVADRLQRDCIGIELNPAYAEIARKRIQSESPLLVDITVEQEQLLTGVAA